MREMVHRAMSGQYPRTKAVLMGRGTGEIGSDTRAITKEFEAPAVINDRSGAVRNALRTGPDAEPVKVEVKVAPPPQPTPEHKPVAAKDVFPNGISPVFRSGSLPSFTQPTAPSVSSSDFSRTSHITVNQGDVNVRGVDDPKRAAEHVGTVQGYRTSDLIRNLRSPLA